jgi:hypothetical protein
MPVDVTTFHPEAGNAYLDAVRSVRIPGGIRLIDIAATAVVIAAVELNVATATGPGQKPLNAVAYLFGAVLPLPILIRRRWPLRELAGCALLMLVYYILDRRNISPAPLLCLPLYDATVAGALVWAIVIPAACMIVGFFVVDASTHQGVASLAAEFLQSIAVLFLAVALGEVVRGRRALAAETVGRLRLATEEREAEAPAGWRRNGSGSPAICTIRSRTAWPRSPSRPARRCTCSTALSPAAGPGRRPMACGIHWPRSGRPARTRSPTSAPRWAGYGARTARWRRAGNLASWKKGEWGGG